LEIFSGTADFTGVDYNFCGLFIYRNTLWDLSQGYLVEAGSRALPWDKYQFIAYDKHNKYWGWH